MVVLCAEIMCGSVFAPSTSEVASGLWPSCILLFIITLTVNVCIFTHILINLDVD